MRRLLVATGIVVTLLRTACVAREVSLLPNRPGSLKFAAIGDNGTGCAAARLLSVGRSRPAR